MSPLQYHSRIELSSGAYVVVPGRALEVCELLKSDERVTIELAPDEAPRQVVVLDPHAVVAVWELAPTGGRVA